jgi:hypothetical protein
MYVIRVPRVHPMPILDSGAGAAEIESTLSPRTQKPSTPDETARFLYERIQKRMKNSRVPEFFFTAVNPSRGYSTLVQKLADSNPFSERLQCSEFHRTLQRSLCLYTG